MASTEPITLTAGLWFEDEPEIDRDDLLRRVHERLPESEVKLDGPVLVAHMRYLHTYEGGETGPIITSILESHKDARELDTSQSHGWEDDVLERCGHSLAVTELFGRLHPYELRVDAFRTTLNAVVAQLDPVAVWLPNSTRVLAPPALLEDPIAPFVNVRLFDVEEDPGDHVMDTLGLHALGMPDFQLHFRDLDAGQAARLLYSLAAYVLERGEVIKSGHTVSSVDGDQQWPCRLEDALAAPDRLVLDVDPGDPYAAGNRPQTGS